MSFRLADVESRRWFWRPALVAAAGALAIGAAIGVNFWQSGEVERSASPTEQAGGITAVPNSGPAAPFATGPLPSFDVVRINPNGDTVIAGRAKPGSVVVLRDGELELGTVSADSGGEWVLLPETPLPPGAHRLSLLMRDGEGGEVASTQEVLVVVPKPGEDIAGRPGTAKAQPLVMRLPRDGGPATLLQKPLSGTAEEPLAIDSVDWQDGRIVLDGHAPPQARVRLAIDGRAVGETVADAAGRWRIVPKTGIGGDQHTLTLEQIDARGTVIARHLVPLALQELTDFAAEKVKGDDQLFVVQKGSNLWRIARTSYGRGAAYTIIYQANRDRIADPHLIYPGQVFRVPAPSVAQAKE